MAEIIYKASTAKCLILLIPAAASARLDSKARCSLGLARNYKMDIFVDERFGFSGGRGPSMAGRRLFRPVWSVGGGGGGSGVSRRGLRPSGGDHGTAEVIERPGASGVGLALRGPRHRRRDGRTGRPGARSCFRWGSLFWSAAGRRRVLSPGRRVVLPQARGVSARLCAIRSPPRRHGLPRGPPAVGVGRPRRVGWAAKPTHGGDP